MYFTHRAKFKTPKRPDGMPALYPGFTSAYGRMSSAASSRKLTLKDYLPVLDVSVLG